MRKESERLAIRHFESLRAYIEPFIKIINQSLIKAKEQGETYPVKENCDDLAEKNVIVRICFVGFFKKRAASQALLVFHHDNQVLQEPEVRCGPTQAGWYFAIGSRRIARNMFGDASPFARNASLEEAIRSDIRYIEAHKHPDTVQIDDFCKFVGGRIHVATVKAREGFEWYDH